MERADPSWSATAPAAMAAAVRRWRRQFPHWTHLHWCPHADLAPAVPVAPEFERELLQALTQTEAHGSRLGADGAAVLEASVRAAADGRQLSVTLTGAAASWSWSWPCPPGLGAQPRRCPRLRVILPATPPPPPRPGDERDVDAVLGLFSANPATVEMVRSLLHRLPCRELWHTGSRRRAQAWLAAHPGCPLWLEEDAAGLALRSPRNINSPELRLSAPLTTTPIWLAARKIYPWAPGTFA